MGAGVLLDKKNKIRTLNEINLIKDKLKAGLQSMQIVSAGKEDLEGEEPIGGGRRLHKLFRTYLTFTSNSQEMDDLEGHLKSWFTDPQANKDWPGRDARKKIRRGLRSLGDVLIMFPWLKVVDVQYKWPGRGDIRVYGEQGTTANEIILVIETFTPQVAKAKTTEQPKQKSKKSPIASQRSRKSAG